MKRLFVTGGHGFVGQWIQRLAPGIATRWGYEIAIPPFDFELLDPAQVDAQLAAARPDAILHLAAQSNVPQSFRDAEGTFRVNVLGTLRLFEGLKRAGLAPRLVYVSSGDVYGQVPEAQMPIGEERLPRPRNPYGVSKVAAEALCYQWSVSEGLPVVVARPFNHVGEGQAETFALPSFARQVAEIRAGRREPVVLTGDVDVTRDFLHVSDVIEAYFVLLAKGAAGETYNIASGEDRSLRSLVEGLLATAGVEATIRNDPALYRRAEQRTVRGDASRLRALGWRPARALESVYAELLDDPRWRTP